MIDLILKENIKEMQKRMILKYVQINLINDYLNGDITLEDFLNESQIRYFNELQKLLILSNYISVSIIFSNSKKININSYFNSLFLDTINENEFKKQTSSNSFNTIENVEVDYIFYIIKENDTLESIAQAFYGDYRQFTLLERENNITNNDLIDKNMTGYVIKIPIIDNMLVKNQYNLVYYKIKDKSQDEINKFYLGNDLSLRNKKIEVDSSHDLKIADPIDTAIQNITDRINTRKNQLNPLHPSYGLNPIHEYNNVPPNIIVKKYIKEITDQIQSEPRVLNVYIDEKEIIIEKNSIYININVKLNNGTTINLKKEIGV
jgi:hypothetical protein